VGSIYLEFGLVALGAMFSPTTLTVSVLALVLGERPKWTGFWFFLGAFGITIAIGIVAAFVIGDDAASKNPSTPKTWVAIVDVIAAVLLIAFVIRAARRPPNPQRTQKMIAQMAKVASSPAIAIVAAGATLANPGGFIPLALKEISELDPSTAQYAVLWIVFTVASMLPLIVALVMLVFAPEPTERVLNRARSWLDHNVRVIAGAIILLLAISLLAHGIAGLTS
jgi:hypothetical protein